jgi:hypothetical protein
MLWYQTTEPEPVLYGDVDQFVTDTMLDDYSSVRLVGMHCNGHLITRMFEEKVKAEVCTPLIVEKRADRRKPGPVLYELGLCARGPSQGGFHEVVESDYHAYKLAIAFDKPLKAVELRPLLEAHPAWKAMDFVSTVWIIDTAVVLAYLVDPRWYIDECYPDRCNKLWSALGLNLHTQAVVTREAPRHRNSQVDICQHTLRAWKNVEHETEVKKLFDLAGTKPIADSSLLGLRPGDFCWRTWGRYTNPVQADLRGSQHFADFLRLTWLNEIYRGSSALPEERAVLFRPADFFKYPEEIHAYEQYQLSSRDQNV